jgi:uncharacterized OB-fold protein
MLCAQCLSPDRIFEFQPVSGRGSIRTWTVVRDGFLPGFRSEVPYVVAEVELEEQAGLRVIGQIVDSADTDLAIGSPVEVVFEDLAGGLAVPHFRPRRRA